MAFLSLVSAPGGWGWFRGSSGAGLGSGHSETVGELGPGRRGFWEHGGAGPSAQGSLGLWRSSVLVSGDSEIVAELGPGPSGF